MGAESSRRCAALVAAGTLAALLAACGGTTATSAAAHQLALPGGSRALAVASARRLLDALVLPPGSQVDRKRPVPAGLARAGVYAGCAGNPLDVDRLYRLSVTAAYAVHYLKVHRPAGVVGAGVGAGLAIGDTETRVPAGIDCIFLAEELLPQAGGKSILRADVELDWYPPRPAAEYLSASRFRSVSISPDSVAGGPSITGGQRFIRPLVRLLDAMPATPALDIFCPAVMETYRLVFAPALAGQGAVVVAGAPCDEASVTVGGRPQLALDDTAPLDALVKRLLKDNGLSAADQASTNGSPP